MIKEQKLCPHKSLDFNGFRTVCRDCKLDLTEKRERQNRNVLIVLGIVAFLIVGDIRLAYVNFIYHDARCFFAECRIMKN